MADMVEVSGEPTMRCLAADRVEMEQEVHPGIELDTSLVSAPARVAGLRCRAVGNVTNFKPVLIV
jgi:hypothetical protein